MPYWRLQRYLAAAGLGSRRSCEALIASGRVLVDGQPAILGTKVDAEASRVEVDGRPVEIPRRNYYVALHKPAGCIVTKSDPQRRNTVMSLLRSLPYASLLNPVGRLDMATEGLLLLTNDGALAYRLTHPSYEVKKTYEVTTNSEPSARQVQALCEGFLLDGRMTAPARAEIIGGGRRRNDGQRQMLEGEKGVAGRRIAARSADRQSAQGGRWRVRLVIHEGRNRQIRRMFEHLGLPVLNLRRAAIGPIGLGHLSSGGHRSLTRKEVLELKRSVGLP